MAEMTLEEIAQLIEGELIGDPSGRVSGVESLSRARKKHITFFRDKGNKNRQRFLVSKAACVLTEPGTEKPEKVGALIYVKDPDAAFSTVCERFAPHPKAPQAGIHPTAVVSSSADIAASASIGPYVVIGDDVVIGERTVVHSHCAIMEGVKVGSDCLFYPHSTIREFVSIGNNVKLQPHAVVGSDGFGYRFENGALKAIPQVGTVELHDGVEIGSHTAVDRARFGRTILKQDAKIDNLVQIGHNVEVGVGTAIASLSGVSGSSIIGDFCWLSGMTGIPDDISVGAGSRLLGRCAALREVEPGSEIYGEYSQTRREYFRVVSALTKLPDLMKEFKVLKSQLLELDKRVGGEGDE